MKLKVVHLLIGAEILWILYYLAVNISVYVETTNSVAEPTGRSIRQDVFGLGTHISVLLAHGAFARTGNGWVFLVYSFELIRDTINLVNIGWYTPLMTLHSLWVAVFVLSWYQTVLSGVALLGFWAIVYREGLPPLNESGYGVLFEDKTLKTRRLIRTK